LNEWRVREKSDNRKHKRRSLEGRLEQQEKRRRKPSGTEEEKHQTFPRIV